MMDDWQNRRDEFLMVLLADVPFDGWSQRLIKQSFDTLNLSPQDQTLLFPKGLKDILAHFSDWADRQMLAAIGADQPAFDEKRMRDRVAFGVRARLVALTPYREAVRQSLPLLARPNLGGLALKSSWETADILWNAAGDTSQDFNRYSKRGLLVTVLTSTSLYWLNDGSDQQEKTWRFLDQRIANVLKLGGTIGKCRSFFARSA